MILLNCPNCGKRNVNEFRYGGEVRSRPPVGDTIPDASDWSGYLYLRANPMGTLREWWYHRAGCGCWFVVERHTKTHDVVRSYLWGEGPQ